MDFDIRLNKSKSLSSIRLVYPIIQAKESVHQLLGSSDPNINDGIQQSFYFSNIFKHFNSPIQCTSMNASSATQQDFQIQLSAHDSNVRKCNIYIRKLIVQERPCGSVSLRLSMLTPLVSMDSPS